jgi:hypothetical protein
VSHGEDWSFGFERVATMQKKTLLLGKMMLAAVGTISLITLASWVWPSADTLVPGELLGEWHTSNAIYSDRSFEIDPVSIRFGTGGGTVTAGFIRKVSAVQQGTMTVYTISYQTDETVNEVCLYYETAKGKVIHLRNQESIAWTKD